MGPTERIASFAHELRLESVPSAVVERARAAFIDTVGVLLAGCNESVTTIVADLVVADGGTPEASLIGRSGRAPVQSAALINGVAAHALDYDFTYMMGQTAAPIIPAVLALAEKADSNAQEVLEAFIIGFEVCSRLGRANPTHATAAGWNAAGTIGTVGAAVSCARLLKLPPPTIRNVVGISASLAAGLVANFATMTKPLNAGMAARNAVGAALLAARGLSANPSALESATGYFASFAAAGEVSFEPFGDLGLAFDLVERGVKAKLYPCGGLGHSAIDATLELRPKLLPRLDEIEKVEVGITRYSASRISSTYPASSESAKFSLPYIAAYTLLRGAPAIAAFDESLLNDEGIKQVAKRVAVAIDPEYADLFQDSPSRVKVTLKNGEVLECARYYASGTPQCPLTDEQLTTKFMLCAATVLSEDKAEQVLGVLKTLHMHRPLDAFWRLVTPG